MAVALHVYIVDPGDREIKVEHIFYGMTEKEAETYRDEHLQSCEYFRAAVTTRLHWLTLPEPAAASVLLDSGKYRHLDRIGWHGIIPTSSRAKDMRNVTGLEDSLAPFTSAGGYPARIVLEETSPRAELLMPVAFINKADATALADKSEGHDAQYTRSSNPCQTGCEADHGVPLELGGDDVLANLWPQPPDELGVPGYQSKDRLENFLHQQVCKGVMPLANAQQAIAMDWYATFLWMERLQSQQKYRGEN